MERRTLTRRSFLAAGALFGAGMVAGCGNAGTTAPSQSDEKEMDRGVDLESDEVMEKMIEVDYSDAGTYTVALTEANLIKDNVVAKAPEEVTPMIAPASGNEMNRDISEVEMTAETGSNPASSTQAAPAAPAGEAAMGEAAPSTEGQPAAEAQAAAEGAEGAAAGAAITVQPADQDQVVADAKAGSFAAVTREGVRVVYNAPLDVAEGEELKTEERIAPIASFSNDGTTITVSFANADAKELKTTYYTVAIDSLASCAVVHASFPTQEVASVDYDAQVAQIDYKPDFTDADVTLPEGVTLEEGKMVLAKDAAKPVVAALEGDPVLAEGEMSRDGGGDKDDDKWKNYDAVSQYMPEYLSFVSKDAAKVAEYGQPFYDVIKGVSTGDLASTLGGTLGVLKLCGIGKGSGGVSNEQILAEVRALRADVDDLRGLTAAMSEQLDKVAAQSYANGLQTFDNAVNALSVNGDIAEDMLQVLQEILLEEGVEAPGDDATAADEHTYSKALIKRGRELERSDEPDFFNFNHAFTALEDNFILVTGELKKPANFNPLTTYKNYWDTYFNYETQAWWLRQAYRSNIEYQLKRTYALLSMYYNIGDPASKRASTHDTLAGNLASALDGMQNIPVGLNPDDIKKGQESDLNIYSGTLQRTIRTIQYTTNTFTGGPRLEKSVAMKLVEKCHGRTLEHDFDLAGLHKVGSMGGFAVNDRPTTKNYDSTWTDGFRHHGLGFNPNKKGTGDIRHDILDWNGEWHSDVKSYKYDKDWYGHTQSNYELVYFVFA